MQIENCQDTYRHAIIPVRATVRRGGTSETIVVPEAEVSEIQVNYGNLLVDLVHMRFLVAPPGRKPFPLKRMRGQPLAVTLKLLHVPGIFLTPYQIASMEPQEESQYIKDNIIQYVAKARRDFFREKGDRAVFIQTVANPYRVAFNRDLDFCLIEPIVTAELPEDETT